jgi:hypothetical protein
VITVISFDATHLMMVAAGGEIHESSKNPFLHLSSLDQFITILLHTFSKDLQTVLKSCLNCPNSDQEKLRYLHW